MYGGLSLYKHKRDKFGMKQKPEEMRTPCRPWWIYGRESDGSKYHQDNTTFQGEVRAEAKVLLTKDSSLYFDGGSGDNAHLCVPVRTQWSSPWWPI